jgi:antirestriction protein ArdC
MAASAPVSFAQLLQDAVNEPGIISTAYRAFHNYSFGNQLLAWAQCMQRGITPGPIATFQRWKELGRYVRKGEKAITLCRPVTVKKTRTAADGTEERSAATWFVYKNYWFVLAQTDGQDLEPAVIQEWDSAKALSKLEITEIPFDTTNGNAMGFARERSIAVSPLNPLPHKTRFHELAHVVLGHTSEGDQNDGELTPRNLKECEAEAVALLCCSALDLPGLEYSRGYIQSWWGEANPIPERSAQRILKAADRILKGGTTTDDQE